MLRVLAVAALVIVVMAVPGQSDPLLRVDFISGEVPAKFAIKGTALNSDVVHAWAFPPSGPVFLGEGWTSEADAEMQRQAGAFTILVTDEKTPTGTYPMVVYAHDAATNTFPTQVGQTITVRACQFVNEHRFFTGPNGPVSVLFEGLCR